MSEYGESCPIIIETPFEKASRGRPRSTPTAKITAARRADRVNDIGVPQLRTASAFALAPADGRRNRRLIVQEETGPAACRVGARIDRGPRTRRPHTRSRRRTGPGRRRRAPGTRAITCTALALNERTHRPTYDGPRVQHETIIKRSRKGSENEDDVTPAHAADGASPPEYKELSPTYPPDLVPWTTSPRSRP
ncbi:hypothetical protein EVAR_21625_1 [Eumeta japonica]|uniref:Uncharacterized protein n=1 Tax=Eumeta variegata TaxID=151549 RepID=A0A4C1UYU8_EUMVA|nr:hypothetical protein EVAR_21625_1 [Eumeta japonica]